MITNSKTYKFKTIIQSHPKEVFAALTDGTALMEWFCNLAHVYAQENGNLYLWWTNDFFVTGQFIVLKSDQKIIFTWHGNGEPAQSKVKIVLKSAEEQTKIQVFHTGLGKGKPWRKFNKRIKILWKKGLDNLKSILESGKDLRVIEELQSLQIEIPEVPITIEELVSLVRQSHEQIQNEITPLVKIRSQFPPDDIVNNRIKELLAQIIAGERELHTWLGNIILGQDSNPLLPSDLSFQSKATLSSFVTLSDLFKELQHNQLETISMLSHLPTEIYTRKSKYWKTGIKLLINPLNIRPIVQEITTLGSQDNETSLTNKEGVV